MNRLAFSVGGLLYSPATNENLAAYVLNNSGPELTAVSICLEDSIRDEVLPRAESCMKATLQTLADSKKRIPMLFVRVRTPEHLKHIHEFLGKTEHVLSGYIFPKFDMSNAERYLSYLSAVNAERGEFPLYAMPILESAAIANIATRRSELLQLRKVIDTYSDTVLNVRVGGNDFCARYGLRRDSGRTIYDLGMIRDILMDILNVFSDTYVVSGPVWEYYGTDPAGSWAEGLKRELALDRANGFIGKTAIHPSQLRLIYESMKVSRADYEDARLIDSWKDTELGVGAGAARDRMNEVNCHGNWAQKILMRAEIYGISEE